MTEVKVEPTDSHVKTWTPATDDDYSKMMALEYKIKEVWLNNNLTHDQYAGLYFGPISNFGGITIKIDHDPGVEVPEEVYNILDKFDVSEANNEEQ